MIIIDRHLNFPKLDIFFNKIAKIFLWCWYGLCQALAPVLDDYPTTFLVCFDRSRFCWAGQWGCADSDHLVIWGLSTWRRQVQVLIPRHLLSLLLDLLLLYLHVARSARHVSGIRVFQSVLISPLDYTDQSAVGIFQEHSTPLFCRSNPYVILSPKIWYLVVSTTL